MAERGWQSTRESLGGLLQTIVDKQQKKKALEQEFQLFLLKQQMESEQQKQKLLYERQMQSQYPTSQEQLTQLNLQKMLQGLQQEQQFNRMADIGFGQARPTAQEILPNVPQQYQQRFMQRPVSPPGLVGQYKQQLRQPYEQAGQTLLLGPKGWEMKQEKPIKQPIVNKQGKVIGYKPATQDKTTQLKIQLQKLAQQEAYRQMGGSFMVGLSEKKRNQYASLVDNLYKSYLKQFGINDNNKGIENNVSEKISEETNIMDTNW